MSEKKKGSAIGNIFAFVVLGVILYSCFGGSDSTESSSERTASSAEDKQKGFHCLSGWDGSHSAFKHEVKRMMRDPDSFEHIETRVTPVSAEGTHTIIMEYRARNGFGGMNVGNALGTYRNPDCSHTVLTVE